MYKLLKVFIFLLLCISSINSQEAKKRIAVMQFEYSGAITKDEARYLTEKVRSALIQTRQYEVISNDQIETMMAVEAKKQGVGPGSCNTEQCIINLGNALECEKMLVGSAGEAFGEYSINAKVLDVVLQQYENAADVSVKDKNDFPKAAKEVVTKLTGDSFESGGISYTGMIWRNALVPGWGHIYANQKRGYIYLGLWSAAGSGFLWSHLNYTSKQKEYDDADKDNVTQAYDEANSAMNLRAYFSYAFLGVTAAILTDILITGKNYTASSTAVKFHSRSGLNFSSRIHTGYNKNICNEYLYFSYKKLFN
ncbi:MAG: hypothetical protein OEZ22_05405 [Spirochaetia bacterium]|nr:hypothetical protein [Spirochaetia bacterium]